VVVDMAVGAATFLCIVVVVDMAVGAATFLCIVVVVDMAVGAATFLCMVVVVDMAVGAAIGFFFIVVVVVLDAFGLGAVAAVASTATPAKARPAVTAMARDVRRSATKRPPLCWKRVSHRLANKPQIRLNAAESQTLRGRVKADFSRSVQFADESPTGGIRCPGARAAWPPS
jgi:hypothetical protein